MPEEVQIVAKIAEEIIFPLHSSYSQLLEHLPLAATLTL
jgi:hypothetical protein